MPLPYSGRPAAGERPEVAELMQSMSSMGSSEGPYGPPTSFGRGYEDREGLEEMRKREERERQERRMQAMAERLNAERQAELERPIDYKRPEPLNLELDLVKGGVERIGGSAKIKIDEDQEVRIGGGYMPAYTEEGGVRVDPAIRGEVSYGTPGFRATVNYRDKRGGGRGGGFGGEVNFDGMRW